MIRSPIRPLLLLGMIALAALPQALGQRPAPPRLPETEQTLQVSEATLDALEATIEKALASGRVTRVVLPENATLPVQRNPKAINLNRTPGLVIDFNGATMDFQVETRWSFQADLGEPVQVVQLRLQNEHAVAQVAEIPPGLRAGDWVRIVSENRAPGHRSDTRRIGQAIQVQRLDGKAIMLHGALYRQGLYQKGIRLARYEGVPANLWLLHPKMRGRLEHFVTFISLESLIQPRVLSPDIRQGRGFFIALSACVEALITDPSLHEGVNVKWPEFTYGIYSFASLRTTVLASPENAPHVTTIRHAIDAGANTPKTPADIASYGPDIGMRTYGMDTRNMLAAAVGCHPGAWHTYTEGVRVEGGDIACTLRGLDHHYRDFQSRSKRGFQLLNGRGFAAPSRVIEELSADNILIESSRIHATEGPVLFTSSYLWEDDGDRQPVGRIRFRDSTATHSGSGTAFQIGHGALLDADNLTLRLDGHTETLFHATQEARIYARDLTIDLSDYQGETLTLFRADAGSVIHLSGITLINPKNIALKQQAGDGQVTGLWPQEENGW